MPDVVTPKQDFIGAFVTKILVQKGVELAVKKGVEMAAKSSHNNVEKSDVPVVTEAVTKSVTKEVQSQVDHKFDQEPAYKSRNVWATIVGLVSATNIIYNMYIDDVTNDPMDYITQVGLILSLLTPMWSRYISKKPIGE